MDERVITTNRGKFGKLQVTLPIQVKNSIMERIDQSGLRRSEYLRIALILGSSQLTKGISENFDSDQGGK